MTYALLRKELSELRPWAILSLFLGLSELGAQLFEQVDMLPTAGTIDMLGASGGRVYWLIAFAIGTGLGPREADEGTLTFLDGLPVGRARVFLVKCVVTAALLAIGPLTSLGTVLWLHGLSHGSLDADLRLDIVLGRFGLQIGAIVSGLLLGSAFGWLRSLAWLAIGVLSAGLSVWIEHVPRAAVLSPFTLLGAPASSAPFAIDLETALVQLTIAALCGAAGMVAFVRAGKPRAALELSGRPLVGAIVTVLTAVALGGALAAMNLKEMMGQGEEEGDDAAIVLDADEQPRFVRTPPAQTSTAHYRFSYPASHADAALALAGQADAIYERVHALLATPATGSIDVDGSGSLENTDGTAYYGRVRISLVADEPAAVLAHETSHVIARRLAGDDRAWLWQQALVLDEGLATWVERHFQTSSDQRSAGRLVLAALHARRELLVEELMDYGQLALVRDDNLKYPAGEAIIAAVIRLHGAGALPRLVRAFATPKLSVDLDGADLWHTAFHLAGMDLGKVFDEMFREVEKDVIERSAEISALPRLRVRLVRNDVDEIGAQVIVDPEGAELVHVLLRFKAEPNASLDDYETYRAEPGIPLWRDEDQIVNGQVCAQPGLSLPPDQTLYEPWTCLPISDAESFADDAEHQTPP